MRPALAHDGDVDDVGAYARHAGVFGDVAEARAAPTGPERGATPGMFDSMA